MRHGNRRRFPASSASHAKSMLRSQAAAVLVHGQIVTTTAKAKALRPYVEKLITKSIHANESESEGRRIAGIRLIDSRLKDKTALDVLMNVTSRVFCDRPGGYTRVLKVGFRDGDGAELSVVQLVAETSSFDQLSSSAEWTEASTAKERYALLKTYCLNNRVPARNVMAQWAGYGFPRFGLTIERTSTLVLRTTLTIPESARWDLKRWPSVRGIAAPLQFSLRFFGDSNLLHEKQVSVKESYDTKALTLHRKESDGAAIAFVLQSDKLDKTQTLVIEHRFKDTSPASFTASVMSPYTTLRSVRSVDKAFVGRGT